MPSPILFKCQHCGFEAGISASSGRIVKCPKCGKDTTIGDEPPVEPPLVDTTGRPTFTVSAGAFNPQAAAVPLSLRFSWAAFFGWILLLCSPVHFFWTVFLNDDATRAIGRFDRDNAWGATANAIERIANRQGAVRTIDIVLVAVLLLIFARLRRDDPSPQPQRGRSIADEPSWWK